LMGGSAGLGAGLVLSRVVAPSDAALGFVAAGGVAGGALGLGVAELAYASGGRHDSLATLAGSSGGLVAGALLAPHLRLESPALMAAALGAGYGALAGTLAPSLGDESWDGGRRAS